MIEKKRIQIRRDLEEIWVNNNPILLYGEIGFDLTNNKIKIGDGEKTWNELSWVNEIDIDLSNYYTKEEISIILNELNTNLSNNYYNKEQVDELIANSGGGGSVGTTNYNELENRPTTNIEGLTYDEIMSIYNFYNENGNLPYSLVYQSYNLNNARINVINEDTTIIMIFTIDGLEHKDIRLWIWTNTNDYGFDFIEHTPNNVFDLRLLQYSKALEIFNYIWEYNEFPSNTTLVIDGVMLNKLERSVEWWDESDGTKMLQFKYYGKPKSYIIRVITWERDGGIYHDFVDVDENETLTTVSEVNELIANSGGGSDTNTNIVDIMALSYDEQIELINYVINNNTFPDINTVYTYHGYILNNLEHYSDWWDETSNQKYIIFDLYAHPKSYDIRFITYQWNEGKIYNDINEKYNRYLVTKEEVDNLIANSGGGSSDIDLSNYYTKEETITEIQNATEVIDLYSADGNTLHEFITYLKDNPTTKLTDKIVTYRGKVCENFVITGDNVTFYHNAFCFREDEKDTDVSFTVVLIPNPAMPQIIQRNYIPDPTGEANVVPTITQMNNLIDDNLNDLNERIQELEDAIDGIEIPEQQEVSNATITIVQGDNNQSFNLNQQENQTIMLENKNFNWFGNETSFESLPDEQKVNGIYYISDKINYKEDITGQPYIVYKTSQLLNDKPFATTNDLPKEWFGTQEEFDLLETYETNTTYYIEINGGGSSDIDLSNYYTKEQTYSKEETNTEIQNAVDSIEIPTTDLSNYYNKQEIDNIVGLINNELEIIING